MFFPTHLIFSDQIRRLLPDASEQIVLLLLFYHYELSPIIVIARNQKNRTVNLNRTIHKFKNFIRNIIIIIIKLSQTQKLLRTLLIHKTQMIQIYNTFLKFIDTQCKRITLTFSANKTATSSIAL